MKGTKEEMKAEYDMSEAKRGPVNTRSDKTRITIWIDNDILEDYRSKAERAGKGYQTLINEALRKEMKMQLPPITEEILRKILREELTHK